MTNEPDVTFSASGGGPNPPGMYCYPIGYGGSTKEKLVCVYIPYPYAPGGTPIEEDPGLLED